MGRDLGKRQEWSRLRNQELRQDALEHYGGIPPRCDCCGETEMRFLTIDHMNGQKGAKHQSGSLLYRFLSKNNYPLGFRVLCANCNHCIGYYGFCPHNGGYC